MKDKEYTALPPHLIREGKDADSSIDWRKLGFKSGLEIHQQLLTEKKLFCRCPAGIYGKEGEHDAEVLRHMRPTLSELGEYDGTALMEFRTRKQILYLLNQESVCTYEMDDTPPFLINQKALDIAIEIALMLNCNLVGELHVMRKQYLDGSIPTGFQRTAIVGTDGYINLRGRRLTILQLALEEDSCRELADEGHTITFMTDRLSMPLVEVVTGPELQTPSEVAEACELIGRMLRSTGKVRRGAGATRQDVNVSIKGGTRIEIKGVPSIRLIPRLVREEALRQKALLEIRDKLWQKDLEPKNSARTDLVDHILTNTQSTVIRNALQHGHRVGAIRLRNMGNILSSKTVGGRTLADEVSGRVRVVACLDEPPYLIHRGTHGQNALTNREWRSIRKRLRAKAEDTVAIVWGPEEDVRIALEEIELRLLEASLGIPPETRQVLPNGLNDFERILPGPDRMYPDTDSPPVPVSDNRIAAAQKQLPSHPLKREHRYLELGMPRHQTYFLAISPLHTVFDEAVTRGFSPKMAARLLVEERVSLRRKGVKVSLIPRDFYLDILDGLDKELFYREGTRKVIIAGAERSLSLEKPKKSTIKNKKKDRPEIDIKHILKELKLEPLKGKDLNTAVEKIINKTDLPQTEDSEAQKRYFMGAVMYQLAGRVCGETVSKIVEKTLERLS